MLTAGEGYAVLVPNRLPRSRGPISDAVLTSLATGRVDAVHNLGLGGVGDALVDEDLHLSLHCLYGLHHDGFRGVEDAQDDLEWDPELLRLRRDLERTYLGALRREQAATRDRQPSAVEMPEALTALIGAASGTPSPSARLAERGTLAEVREMLIHRSIYQRKEADGHTWGIPRLRGEAKSALVLIQADEYGHGQPGRSHAELFGVTMDRLGLDPTPGAYIDVVPGLTLATDNLVTMFGLHRRLRGALVGHLAVFEMTSVVPMGRYAAAIRRLTGDDVAAEFYDVHVAADAVHEVVAAERLAAGAVRAEPDLAADVVFGARAVLASEGRLAAHLVACWDTGRSSLRLESLSHERLDLAGRRRHPHPVAG